MTHADILAKAEAWRRGELPPSEQTEWTGHVKNCPACGELLGKWPGALPPGDMTRRVMARLPQAKELPVRRKGLRLVPLAAGLAAVLLVAAFWHPERKWVEEDKYFARFDHNAPVGAAPAMKENFYE